jgi:hypothetical protein
MRLGESRTLDIYTSLCNPLHVCEKAHRVEKRDELPRRKNDTGVLRTRLDAL